MSKLSYMNKPCPNCGSHATVATKSLAQTATKLITFGVIAGFTVIGLIIAFPLLMIGFPMLFISLVAGKTYNCKCKTCKYEWSTTINGK